MITKMCCGVNVETQAESKDDKPREIFVLCLGAQSNLPNTSEIIVFELDPKIDFEVLRSFRFNWPQE